MINDHKKSMRIGLKSVLTGIFILALTSTTNTFAIPPTLAELQALGARIAQQLSPEKRDVILGITIQLRQASHDRAALLNRISSETDSLHSKITELDRRIVELVQLLAEQLVSEPSQEESESDHTHLLANLEGGELASAAEGMGIDSRQIETPQLENRSCLSSWKQKIGTCCFAALSAACVIGSGIIDNDWIKAGLLSTGAAILYSASGLIGNRIPLPSRWSHYPTTALRALIGAALVFPGNLLGYSSVQIALRPGSTVNIVATNSLLIFVNELASTCGALVFLDQPATWPVWVGIVVMAGVAGLQTWHAMENPRPLGS